MTEVLRNYSKSCSEIHVAANALREDLGKMVIFLRSTHNGV